MEVKNNYKECLTNLACSIRKYFELDYKHNTLRYIDDILEETKPKNVVVMLFDGMGSRIINRNLSEESFFRKNMLKEITTVFPATTTAATTSIRTGLNPIEHGWLGWNMYIKPIDKIITLFLNCEKGNEDVVCEEFLQVKDKLVSKTISDEINEKTNYKAMELFPFNTGNAIVYENLDDMMNIIETETKKDGKKFIYAYDPEPDHTMHDFGPDSNEALELINIRNKSVEELCERLDDTLVIIIADHGHKKVEHIYLNDYPQLVNMLERNTSLEQRAVSFKIKDEYKKEFKSKFNEAFKDDYTLYSKEEIIESNLFGDGDKNELFDSAIGDYIAITDTDKCIVFNGDEILCSQHAGYNDDEIYVPIILSKIKKR